MYYHQRSDYRRNKYTLLVDFFLIYSKDTRYTCTKYHTLFSYLKKSTLLRKYNVTLSKITCKLHHEMFIDLPTERHPVLQTVSLYISSTILSKYTCNLSMHVQATHQQGCFGNRLSSQIVCQCLKAMFPAHLDMNERTDKQNV